MIEFFWVQMMGRCPKCKSKLIEEGYMDYSGFQKVRCDKCGGG